MSWPDMMTPWNAGPAVPPRELILSALDDAIVYRTADFAFCHDCERAIDGLCSLHRDDSAMADNYEAVRKQILSAPDAAVPR